MIRTSTLIAFSPPTRSIQPSCKMRNMRTWAAGGNSPISSRNSVPPSARSNQPRRASTAPVNAPRSWPKSCESISSDGIAPQLTRSKGPLCRAERLWIARATNSLPVPVSPKISTGASERATSSTRSMTARSPESTPTIVSPSVLRPSRVSSERLSASAASRKAAISRRRRSFSKAAENGSKSSWANSACSGSKRCPAGGRKTARRNAPPDRPTVRPTRRRRTGRKRAGQLRHGRVIAPTMHHLLLAAPRQQRLEFGRRAIGPGVGQAAASAGQPHRHGLQARAGRIDPPHEHLLDRDMAHQHGDDLRGRLANVDVPASLLPDTQKHMLKRSMAGGPLYYYQAMGI